MTFLLLALLILATYRLTRLISKDYIFEPLRRALGRLAARRSKFWLFVAELFACPHCLGVWISAVMALAVAHSFFEWCLFAMAFAGGQSLLQDLSDHS